MIRFHLARFVFKIIQTTITKLVVHGRENIPAQGPYIVAVNHMSSADTPLLLLAFPAQRWHFFAGEKWHEHWLWGPLMDYLGAIYINRGQVDRAALKEALAAIDEGAVFGLAPEGTRSKVGTMQAAKDGAAYLAVRSQVSVVPVGLVNTDVLFANVRRFRRSRVEAFIGEPFTMPDLGRRVRSRDLAAYTHLIMVQIAAQLPPRYHGLYADSPALHALQAGEDPWAYCLDLIEGRKEVG
jgi:1-acyl-sn-glycerol-3-phosphate acyltransferase